MPTEASGEFPGGEAAAESESLEVRARFADADESWAALVETIVAMANTSGGTIVLEAVESDLGKLEPARLTELVNRYAGPPVRGLERSVRPAAGVEIRVPESTAKPHVFKPAPPGSEAVAPTSFHPGQVWVRHGAKNRPATPEDLERMLRQRVATYLDELRARVLQAEALLALSEGDGVPVRFSDEPGAVPVSADIDKAFPYTARTLGEAVGKPQNWAAAAVECLDLKERPEYWFGTRGSRGAFAVQRYSERAAERLREKLRAEPAWNPFAELRRRGKRPGRRRRAPPES